MPDISLPLALNVNRAENSTCVQTVCRRILEERHEVYTVLYDAQSMEADVKLP